MSAESTAEAPTTQPSVDRVSVKSECGQLRKVFIGTPENFPSSPGQIPAINNRARDLIASGVMPTQQAVRDEINDFKAILEEEGVEVLQPIPLTSVAEQLFVRDIGFVIDSVLIQAQMTEPERQGEFEAIVPFLEEDAIPLVPPAGVKIEGGDIILDQDTIYVGLSKRTNSEALAFLREQFPHYQVKPVALRPPSETFEALHLDCAFVPLGNNCALVYEQAFEESLEALFGERDFITLTKEEQYNLACNVLSVSPDTVIVNSDSPRIIAELKRRGFKVRSTKFSIPIQLGGAFRCCSMPLIRDKA